MKEFAIYVRNIYKYINNVKILDGVSFNVRHKDAFCILGPNGAGKTTTIRILTGIYLVDKGEVWINNLNIRDNLERIKEIIGYLPETPSLYDSLTVYRNLEFHGKLFGLSGSDLKSQILHVLELVELRERMDEKVGRLSKGIKQRVAIARALINNPEILILDQPTSDLDPAIARSVRNLIKRLNHDQELTLLVCTHNLTEAEEICNKVAIMNKGRIVGSGYVNELKKKLMKENIFEITLFSPVTNSMNRIMKLEYVREVWSNNKFKLYVKLEDKEDISNLLEFIIRNGCKVFEVNYIQPNLEEIYLKLLGENFEIK